MTSRNTKAPFGTKPGFPTTSPFPAPAFITPLNEVRYSLPAMLQELKAERTSATFAMEILDQNEIGKLFKAKSARRGKSAK
jgi:hypothetical protein